MTLLTARQRWERGEQARERLARSAQALWDPPATRQSPVDILRAQQRTRIASLLPIRYQRMRASPFAFLRGAAAVMAADLGALPNAGIVVQLCGDAHLMNFGSYASPEGNPVFDVNDFDETHAGPFEWDLKRLAASFSVNGHDNGFSAAECRALARRCARHYRRHMRRLADMPPLEVWHSSIDLCGAITDIESHSLRRRIEKRLAGILEAGSAHYNIIDEAHCAIIDGGNIRHMPELAGAIEEALHQYSKTLQPHFADLIHRFALKDRAMKIVGIGSVGTLCAIGLFVSGDGAPLLLQVKEAQDSVLAPFAPAATLRNQGQRVVTGQRRLQALTDIFLGWTEKPIDGRFFYVRKLKDSRLADIGARLETDMLKFSAALCGRTLARAHGRAGDAATLAGYMGEGSGQDGENFDDAIAAFAMSYAEQTRRDHLAFCAALDNGTLEHS